MNSSRRNPFAHVIEVSCCCFLLLLAIGCHRTSNTSPNGNSGATNYCGSANAPGNYAESYAVGATDAGDTIATFSSRGPTVDGRIKPDVSAPGVKVPSAWPDGTVRLLSGTSMATPHVAGVAALLWSANPTLIG